MIRALARDDHEPVLDLLRATGNFNAAELAIADELIRLVIDQPDQRDYYSFVAEAMPESHPGIAGFLILGPAPATLGSWHMYWLAVHPGSYGKGIGTALQLHAEDFVRRRDGYWLLGETSSQPGYQRARAFYRKQGYGELGRVADYYKPFDDMLLFGKRLGSTTPNEARLSHVACRIIPGKNRGVVATRPFGRDEIIERAPVILISKSDSDLLSQTILSRYYYDWTDEKDGKGEPQDAIVLGLGSLYNHSYTPNAIYIRDYEQNEMEYKALRDIGAGEEITVNYNGKPDGGEPVDFSAI